jgi:hypothetical protein
MTFVEVDKTSQRFCRQSNVVEQSDEKSGRRSQLDVGNNVRQLRAKSCIRPEKKTFLIKSHLVLAYLYFLVFFFKYPNSNAIFWGYRDKSLVKRTFIFKPCAVIILQKFNFILN